MKRVRALIMRKDVAASHILPGLACSVLGWRCLLMMFTFE